MSEEVIEYLEHKCSGIRKQVENNNHPEDLKIYYEWDTNCWVIYEDAEDNYFYFDFCPFCGVRLENTQ